MMTDAELNVLYGAGLKPATAMRVIDELRQQKAKAEAWEDLARESIEMLAKIRARLSGWHNWESGRALLAEDIMEILDGSV